MSKILTYETWDHDVSYKLNNQLKDYMDVLKWSFSEYGDKIVYACSFGAEGVVLLDLLSKVNKKATIIFLDTGLHFQETYDLIEKIKKRYPEFTYKFVEPRLSLKKQTRLHGNELWNYNPNLCCHLRKIQPLTEELSTVEAWISGLRRGQSPTRKHVEYINKDDKFQKIKICPLIHWTWDDIWNYIQLFDLPYNELHDKNYPSIGCEKCTLPVSPGADLRAGRWIQSNKTECGLHP